MIVAFGQRHALVDLGDLGIVPLGDLAVEDVGQNLARQLELAGGNALDVVDGDHAAHHGRELDEAVLLQLFALQRSIGRAEIDRLGADLADAAAGADRLIVQAVAGLLVVGLGPLGIDREREGRACAGDVSSRSRSRKSSRRQGRPQWRRT